MAVEIRWLRPGDASRFIEALADLPADRWLRAGLKARENPFGRTAAVNALEGLANEDCLALSLWDLCDSIETVAWYCLPEAYRAAQAGARYRELREAVEAAHVAAFAVLLRFRLGERRFRILYAPFDELVPPPLLSR